MKTPKEKLTIKEKLQIALFIILIILALFGCVLSYLHFKQRLVFKTEKERLNELKIDSLKTDSIYKLWKEIHWRDEIIKKLCETGKIENSNVYKNRLKVSDTVKFISKIKYKNAIKNK